SDDTVEAIEAARAHSTRDIVVIHRDPGERSGGLGGAVVAGMRAARGEWVCVMDADLQHPPEVIPRLLDRADGGGADLVVASRYSADEAVDGFGRVRSAVSRVSTTLARGFFPMRLRGVTDPLSGFFLVRRTAVDLERLRPRGFKILLEILARSSGLHTAEVAFEFGRRNAGKSKASVREGLRYLAQLCSLRAGESLATFARFGFVGASGLVINLL